MQNQINIKYSSNSKEIFKSAKKIQKNLTLRGLLKTTISKVLSRFLTDF